VFGKDKLGPPPLEGALFLPGVEKDSSFFSNPRRTSFWTVEEGFPFILGQGVPWVFSPPPQKKASVGLEHTRGSLFSGPSLVILVPSAKYLPPPPGGRSFSLPPLGTGCFLLFLEFFVGSDSVGLHFFGLPMGTGRPPPPEVSSSMFYLSSG